ncbi:UDP-glucose 4-epimerase GalE [Alkalicoccus urumqiensis]|uniref:UDP-glucose 4-epimerase n=1 Tax=Alkalicoccus urumqiensis TaxID=1548213 RepID=A0A2P6ML99_ALKUR|nr:UDP-glucose 4-epimerase GalE [Alkalicoccus urumqiensis]PRO67058.1 UDP-glucose 4-epimerase GalE [Alkalicoccus urumqiensis]
MHVVLTGGTGFIGSHTCAALMEAGYDPILIDNLSNSTLEVHRRLEEMTGKRIPFIQADLRDPASYEDVFTTYNVGAVIHFAGWKAVGESVEKPLDYYHNNLSGTLQLLSLMEKYKVTRMVFSSSATVYGTPQITPIPESHPLETLNPYGRTKLMLEQILLDWFHALPSMRIAVLRYFNPAGAHPSGAIGEVPTGTPANIMPYITQTAAGIRPKLRIFGNDYPTADGTGIRDYIHIQDLASGHVRALDHINGSPPMYDTFNLGTGNGWSVLELIRTFEQITGQTIPHTFAPRRPGDVAVCYADPSKAESVLGWKAVHTLEDICRDAWRWESREAELYHSR